MTFSLSLTITATARRRSGSISDILNAFPPPGLETPTGQRRGSRFPSPFQGSNLAHSEILRSEPGSPVTEKKQGRRCCGMRLWKFILLMVVLLILVAAAVIVPIFLIVLPRQHHAAAAQASQCENGGTSFTDGNTLHCVCVNGFTGDKCQTRSDNGCVVADIDSSDESFGNATLGSSIPRLLQASTSTFNIPLNSSTILGLFSSNNLSCTSENALVTFNGVSTKAKRFYPLYEGNHLGESIDSQPTGTINLAPRDVAPTAALAHNQVPVATSNGIIFMQPSSTAVPPASSTPTLVGTASSSGSSSTPASSTNNNQGLRVTQKVLDFSRVAVLFIFQQTGALNQAADAQTKIQDFLNNQPFSTSMTMDSGEQFLLDFNYFTITDGHGDVFGGNNSTSASSASSSSSANAKSRRRLPG